MIYYRPIQSVPPAAGWVFELRTHQVFTKEQTIQVFPLRGCRAKVNLVYDNYTSSKERQNLMNLRLTESTEHPLVEADLLKQTATTAQNPTASPESTRCSLSTFLMSHSPSSSPSKSHGAEVDACGREGVA
jgi:hypothetical protein